MNIRINKIFPLAFSVIFLALTYSENATAQEKKNQLFVGLTYTPSFPVGDFADNSINNENAGFAKRTISFADIFLDFEFIFKNNLGVSSTYMAEDYSIEQNGFQSNLSFSCITLGPVYSFTITKNLALDLKCQLGYVQSLLVTDGNHNDEKEGEGLGVDVRSLLRYQVFKRWCLIAQFGYLSSKQNFDGLESINIQAVNAGVGVGFKIK
jgi:hypothetical protein